MSLSSWKCEVLHFLTATGWGWNQYREESRPGRNRVWVTRLSTSSCPIFEVQLCELINSLIVKICLNWTLSYLEIQIVSLAFKVHQNLNSTFQPYFPELQFMHITDYLLFPTRVLYFHSSVCLFIVTAAQNAHPPILPISTYLNSTHHLLKPNRNKASIKFPLV